MGKLQDLLTRASERCEAEGVRAEGDVLRWVMRNCAYQPGQEFFLVTLLCAELADREARREGFSGQADRAASRCWAGK